MCTGSRHTRPPLGQRKTVGRFTHLDWKSQPPGLILDGVWLAPRQVVKKDGDQYQLGEVEHADGLRTGFTCPLMLCEKTKGLPIGVRVRIRYDGVMKTTNDRTMYKFSVRRVAADERI